MEHMHHSARLLVILLCLAVVGVSCRHRPAPAKAPNPTPGQITRGKTLYETHCANCHDLKTGIGPKLTKDVIATHVSATSLFNYTRKSMPPGAPNSLQTQDYWDITAYMLYINGFATGETDLDPASAKEISLSE